MPLAPGRGETLVDVFSTVSSFVNPNLIASCSTFNAPGWVMFGGTTGTGPSFSGTLLAAPFRTVDAQQLTFTDPRCGFYQTITPTLSLNASYTFSIYFKLISGSPAFFIGYYNGINPVAQYSTLIVPTGAWQRTSFTIFTGVNGTTSPGATSVTDPTPSFL